MVEELAKWVDVHGGYLFLPVTLEDWMKRGYDLLASPRDRTFSVDFSRDERYDSEVANVPAMKGVRG